jgi:hypothetical protein
MSLTKHLGQGDSFAAFIDLLSNELRNPIGHQLGSAPGSPTAGQFYYDTALHELRFWNGTAWFNFDGSSFTLVGDATGLPSATVVGKVQGVAQTAASAAIAAELANATARTATATLLAGEETIFTGSTAAQTLTLPVTPQVSTTNTILNLASVSLTVAPGAGATINNFAVTGNITVLAGEVVSLIYVGTVWYALSSGISARGILAAITTDLASYLQLAGGTMTGVINLGGYRAENGTTPTVASDLATKGYVDGVAQGLDAKPSVRVTATSALSAVPATGGLLTIDGITVSAGDRVLATAQATASQNGIWVAASGAWSRPTDFDSASTQLGAFVMTEQGTANIGSGWVMTGLVETVDTTSETWVQFSKVTSTGLAKYAASIGNGSLTSIAVTHSLGTTDVQVTVMDASGNFVLVDWTATSTSVVTFNFATAPASNAYRVVILG